MLLFGGNTKVEKTWKVEEDTACGYVRMYYLKSGSAIYESETECVELKKDYLYCFPSRVPYKIRQNSQTGLECFFVHMDVAPYVLSSLQEIEIEKHTVLQKLIEALELIIIQEEENVTGALQQKMTEAIIEYLIKIQLLEKLDPKIEKSIRYMLERAEEPIKLEEISAYCGYHPQYFIRLFKSCIGQTPHQFIIRHRMKKAMSMLLEGESVTKTAEEIGYRESKNFSRTFRQVYGVTPSDVKKDLRIIP